MSDNSVLTGALSSISSQEKFKSQPKQNELGQDTFLQLMVAQMNNQNPLEPQSNSEFVAQLAQFSSVEGIDKLNTNFESMMGTFQSSQALQASSMVGRKVSVATQYGNLTEGGQIEGTFLAPSASGDVTLNIYSDTGQLVSTDKLASTNAGSHDFSWDGRNDNGELLNSGRYRIEILAAYGDETQQLGTQMQANVDSVTVGGNGALTLNVEGVGPVLLSKVRNISD